MTAFNISDRWDVRFCSLLCLAGLFHEVEAVLMEGGYLLFLRSLAWGILYTAPKVRLGQNIVLAPQRTIPIATRTVRTTDCLEVCSLVPLQDAVLYGRPMTPLVVCSNERSRCGRGRGRGVTVMLLSCLTRGDLLYVHTSRSKQVFLAIMNAAPDQ